MFVSLVSESTQVKKRIILGVISITLSLSILMLGLSQSIGQVENFEQGSRGLNIEPAAAAYLKQVGEVQPGDLIRFHVIANSDSEEDQLLKYSVRDEILKKVAPRLANSASLEESRAIITGMESELLEIASKVVADWGKNYKVSMDFGFHNFPTKSYGNIVLPSGEYEAVKIKIGEANGANWWCVLFPPICFVNVEESTTVSVDGKPGVPLDSSSKPITEKTEKNTTEEKSIIPENITYKGKKVGFFFERFIRLL